MELRKNAHFNKIIYKISIGIEKKGLMVFGHREKISNTLYES